MSLKETLAWLSAVKPDTFYDSATEGGPTHPWESTPFSFEGCTLRFKDRWLLPGQSRSWVINTVSLLDLDEHRVIQERQGEGGVGLRLVTNGYLFKREWEEKGTAWSDFTTAPKEINSYYVNIGDAETTSKVALALVHAIKLCKAGAGK